MYKIIPFLSLAASLYFLSQGMAVAFSISFVVTGISAAAAILYNGLTFESPKETAQREAEKAEKIREYEKQNGGNY